MTEEFSIRFRAFEGSPQIHQEPAYGKTILTVPQEHPEQGKVIAVRIDGVGQKFRADASVVLGGITGVVVNWFPLQGARIEVVCLRPKEPSKLPQDIRATTPPPLPHYGLQPPLQPRARGS